MFKSLKFDLITKFGNPPLISPKVNSMIVQATPNIVIKDAMNIISVVKALQDVTNQTPKIFDAKKSIASFSIREGMVRGAFVTLHNNKASNYYLYLLYCVLPSLYNLNPIKLNKWGVINIGIGPIPIDNQINSLIQISLNSQLNNKEKYFIFSYYLIPLHSPNI